MHELFQRCHATLEYHCSLSQSVKQQSFFSQAISINQAVGQSLNQPIICLIN